MCTNPVKFTVGKKYVNCRIIRECIAVYDNHAVLAPAENSVHLNYPTVVNRHDSRFYEEYKPSVVHTAHVYFWRNSLFGDRVHQAVAETEITSWMNGTQVLNHQIVTWTEERN